MELALATLLVSALTCVGLLALWAATSPWHWFVRTAIFLAVISLLLLIPAYEPFVAFALQGAVVAGGIQWARRWNKESDHSPNKTRFSLATLLQLVVVFAILAAVTANLPTLYKEAWQSTVMIGLIGGCASLDGWWIYYGRYSRRRRLSLGVLLALLLSVPLLLSDRFVESIVEHGGWSEANDTSLWPFAWVEISPVWLWIFILGIQVGLSWILVALASALANPGKNIGKTPLLRWFTALSYICILIGIAAPSAYTYYALVDPLLIPKTKLPSPNGYDEIVAAGGMIEGALINSSNFDWETATPKQLSKAVNEVRTACERARRGIQEPCYAPINYTSLEVFYDSMSKLMNHRALARCFAALGRHEEINEKVDAALENYLTAIELGFATRRGGLLVDALVGMGSSGTGSRQLYQMRRKLNDLQCREAIGRVADALSDVEPFESFFFRDRIWSQHVEGWHGRLSVFLSDLTGDYWMFNPKDFEQRFLHEQAALHLLILELALQSFHATEKRWPEQLIELVPHQLSQIPLDPYAQDNVPFVYRLTGDRYLLYSVGPNGKDEGGVKPSEDEFSISSALSSDDDGDLRLDVLYAPYEEDLTTENSEEEMADQEGQGT